MARSFCEPDVAKPQAAYGIPRVRVSTWKDKGRDVADDIESNLSYINPLCKLCGK